jgi:L-iditol 2-dehydrogenase
MHNRAAVMYGTHDVRLEDKPLPDPGPKEVLVKIKAVGVCGSDVHYYEEGRIGSFVVEEPLILGHESMGTVVALGDEATKHEVGDRVTLEPGVPDMTCRECRAGRYNLCPNFQELRQGEVRRILIPRTPVNKGIRKGRGCLCPPALLNLILS